MSPIVITLLVLAAAVGLFVWNRLPVGVVAIGVALALSVTGVLDYQQALAGARTRRVMTMGLTATP